MYDGGQYESSCARSSLFGPFSGCRIGTSGLSRLRLRTLWLRLRRVWVRPLRLRGIRLRSSSLWRTGHGRNDGCYRDARRSGLHSAVRRANHFAVTIRLPTWRWVRLNARVLEPRLLGPMACRLVTPRPAHVSTIKKGCGRRSSGLTAAPGDGAAFYCGIL